MASIQVSLKNNGAKIPLFSECAVAFVRVVGLAFLLRRGATTPICAALQLILLFDLVVYRTEGAKYGSETHGSSSHNLRLPSASCWIWEGTTIAQSHSAYRGLRIGVRGDVR